MPSIQAYTPYLYRAGNFALGVAAFAVTIVVLASTFGAPRDRHAPGRGDRAAELAPLEGATAALSVWTEISNAGQTFILGETAFGRDPDHYAARSHSAGGGRLDQLTFGSAAQPGPFLLLSIYRPLDEPVRAVSFWLEMARRAGEAGLALERASPVPELAPTRLGPFELGALKARGRFGLRDCLGFRRQSIEPLLFISGVACPGEGRADAKDARETLVCALEAISLAGGENDRALEAFFQAAGPPACSTRRSAQLR